MIYRELQTKGGKMKICEIIETLECAKINVDNIKRGGLVFCELVKEQINSALEMLNKLEEKDNVD
jgi:hypothetical protein